MTGRGPVYAMLLCSLGGAIALQAQEPAPPPPPMRGAPVAMGPLADPAAFLLAHTGALQLTDAQVVRLAAVARREATERQGMRAQFDSLRTSLRTARAADTAARGGQRGFVRGAGPMRAMLTQFRHQLLANRRDAIAVLTPDQQAQAWALIAASRARMRMRFGARWMYRSHAMHRRGVAPRRGDRPGAPPAPPGGPPA